MRKNVNSVDKNSPEYWAKMIAGGRYSLLLIVILTVVNIVLLLVEADRYFGICTIIALVIGVLLMGVYMLCWALGEKKPGWLTAALVLFSLDTVVLLIISFTLIDSPLLNLMDIILHALAIYELVMAVICAGKLKRQAVTEPCCTSPEIY